MIAERVRAGLRGPEVKESASGGPPISPALEKRIREALAAPGRPGVRVIAKQFGVDPGTVQRISRPFEASAAVVGTAQHSSSMATRSVSASVMARACTASRSSLP
jgi:hypothetical protein